MDPCGQPRHEAVPSANTSAPRMGFCWNPETDQFPRPAPTRAIPCKTAESPTESDGMVSGSSWELSSVEDEDHAAASAASSSARSPAPPAASSPTTPLPPTTTCLCSPPPLVSPDAPLPVSHPLHAFHETVRAQRVQRAQEKEMLRQTYNLDMVREQRWGSEEHARIALNILLLEAATRDMEIDSEAVSQEEKQRKWCSFLQYITEAVDVYGRSAADCKDKLVNYHMFQSDIPADNMSIDMFAMSQRKRQMLQHLDMTGKLFLDS